MKNYIETERIVMRPVKLSDAEDIFEYAKEEETGPRAGWPPHKNIEETKQIINKWTAPDCNENNFAIIYKPYNKVIGTMGYTHKERNSKNTVVQDLIKNGNKLVEIGFVVSKACWGKGIATECLNAMLDYLFVNEDIDMVITCHAEPNIGSSRVQDKCGMNIIGSHENEKPWFNTENTNHIVRAKTREEWEQEKIKTI